jgi:hypothetical protein
VAFVRTVETVSGAPSDSPRTPPLNRRLPAHTQPSWRQSLATVCAAHAGLGPASLVKFDVSTLYFETGAGDGFRESV